MLCRRPAFIAILFLAFLFSDQAVAQEGAEKGKEMSSLIEEITVTARKREESLQDTPMSISAFSGESLEARGITKVDEIQNISPNLSFYSNSPVGAAANSAGIFIRGIGQSDFVPTTEPGVGLYVDGVYLGRSVGSVLDLLDIDRVEVLRGPQGTLFGRNSTGGAVNIVTQKPDDNFAIKASVTVGTDNKADGTISVNGPITKNLFAKISAAKLTQDGYVKNTQTGQDLGNQDTFAFRAATRWLATSDVTVDLSFDYSRDRSHGVPYINQGTVFIDPTQPGGPNFTFISNVFLGPLNGCDATFANPAGSLTNPACINDQYIGKNGGLGDFHSNVDVYGMSAAIEWDITDSLKAKSITAYRNLDSSFAYDGDATPVFIVDGILDVMTQHQITQELQLLGTSLDSKLEWILGLYYFQEHGKDINPVDFLPVSLQSGGYYDNDSVAGYAQGTYHVTDKLDLTAGIRYTTDTKRFLPDQIITGGLVTLGIPGFPYFPVGTRALPHVQVKTSANDWTPMVNLAYHLTPAFMVYGTYSEGFKGGGFEQRVFPPLPATPSFQPEHATSYELGFKYANEQNTFVLNGSGFHTDYDNLQVTVFTAIAPVLDNAGNASIDGFELESHWVPAESWFVEGSAGYLQTGYKSVLPGTGLTGNERLPRVPDWSLSASLTKEFGLGDKGTLTSRVDWSYRSSIDYDTFNTPFIRQPGYHIFNFNTSWESVSGRYGLIFRIKNLADKHYSHQEVYQAGFGNILGYLDRGREWSLTAKVNF